MNKVTVNIDNDFAQKANSIGDHIIDAMKYAMMVDSNTTAKRPKVKSIDFQVDPEQRATVCIVITKTGNKFVGVAKCHPQDNFYAYIGRKVSLTKAIEPMNKYSRKMVWDFYFKKYKICGKHIIPGERDA